VCHQHKGGDIMTERSCIHYEEQRAKSKAFSKAIEWGV